MPIYAYKCASCGFAKDVLQKLSDAPLTVCPSCGQPRFAKQVTAAAFQLKGSGWYVTDFRNEGSAPAEANGAGEKKPETAAAERLEPGMVLTVRFEGGDTETFLLGVRGAEYGDMEVYSVQSPLGAAIVGARPGEQRFYQVPSGDSIPVTLVSAVPFGLHALT